MTEAASERTARVLLIQDAPDRRVAIAGALRRAGFEVIEVASGIAGLEAATTSRPDLLLIDLHLPDLDGAEVTSRLRRIGMKDLPIVAMGQPGTEHGIALSAGCNGTVPNPPDLEALPGQLREFLAGKRDQLDSRDEWHYLKVLNESLVEKLESKVRELTATNERMRRVDELKTEFMRSISHELSTPLTPLLGYLKIFHGEKLGPLNERQTKVVESMIQSTERLSRTVDNLSDFAVLETGNYRVRAEPVDLVALAIRLIEQTQVTLGKPKRVHISLEAPGRNVILMADPARLTQAVGNLIENAVKLSPHGGEVLVEISDSDDRARISVYDQGTGVLTEDQDKVFEPYYRSRDARHMATAGLGLPVARKIAEAHGGRLIVESPPKLQPESERHFSGSKFILELPSPPKH